jgi:hypothetical protein
MSRTDVHRPAWVKDRDPHERGFVAHHNHATGPCDLADYLAAKGWTRTRCYPIYTGGRNIYCGCAACTGQDWRRQERRRDRYGWRRELERD